MNIKNILKVVQFFLPNGKKSVRSPDRVHVESLSLSLMAAILNKMTPDTDRRLFYDSFDLDRSTGYYYPKDECQKNIDSLMNKYDLSEAVMSLHDSFAANEQTGELYSFDRIHYGCGGKMLSGWLNVDCFPNDSSNYRKMDLAQRHPFPEHHFQFGFAEDVLEHLQQDDSIIFLSECYRTLRKEGVLRLSFPGLEGVLERHYRTKETLFAYAGKMEAYLFWDHFHFYSKEELALIAKHVGFSEIAFVEYGKSCHKELCDLDSRFEQIGLNTYAELKK